MRVHRLLTLGPENESLWVRHTSRTNICALFGRQVSFRCSHVALSPWE
jgi:hypothetical protein